MQTNVIPLRQIIADGGIKQNVITVRLLALCPMLAVSVSINAAAALGVLTSLVMAVAGLGVAVLRGIIPTAVRLPIFLLLVATLVALADIVMAAFAPNMHRQLGIFLPLIITNCAVLARLEVFASRQPPGPAFVDGIATGAGMTAALLVLAALRETLARGALAGWSIFDGVPAAVLPVGGFILFAFMLAGLRGLGISASS